MKFAHEERWGVIGGGFLGMTLALRLAQRGRRVTLYEASDHLGGLADAWQLGDVTWDRHYHVMLLSDQWTRQLLRELDLEREIHWVETKTGFYSGAQLHSMSNSWEFLRFPPLGLIDKFRLAATIAYAARIRNWHRLEHIPVAQWLRTLSGSTAFTKMWLPLLRAKLGENYRHTSAAFIWATIARMYAARRTGLKKEMFGYVPGGYGRIVRSLEQALWKAGVEVRTAAPIRAVRRNHHGGLHVEMQQSGGADFERVVVTAPAPIAAKMCPELGTEEQGRLLGIQYLGIVCASVLLRQPLDRYYVTNITDDGLPFTGVIEMSALVDRAEFNGHALVYLPKYVAPDDPIFDRSDADIQQQFLSGLERMYPRFTRDDVVEFRISRVRNVFALPTLDYSSHLPAIRTTVPGLFVVNSAHIVNGTLNVNETVRLAEESLESTLLSGDEHACEPAVWHGDHAPGPLARLQTVS